MKENMMYNLYSDKLAGKFKVDYSYNNNELNSFRNKKLQWTIIMSNNVMSIDRTNDFKRLCFNQLKQDIVKLKEIQFTDEHPCITLHPYTWEIIFVKGIKQKQTCIKGFLGGRRWFSIPTSGRSCSTHIPVSEIYEGDLFDEFYSMEVIPLEDGLELVKERFIKKYNSIIENEFKKLFKKHKLKSSNK